MIALIRPRGGAADVEFERPDFEFRTNSVAAPTQPVDPAELFRDRHQIVRADFDKQGGSWPRCVADDLTRVHGRVAEFFAVKPVDPRRRSLSHTPPEQNRRLQSHLERRQPTRATTLTDDLLLGPARTVAL